jgi:hypothetical protein
MMAEALERQRHLDHVLVVFAFEFELGHRAQRQRARSVTAMPSVPGA